MMMSHCTGGTIENVLLFVIASATYGHNFCSMSNYRNEDLKC